MKDGFQLRLRWLPVLFVLAWPGVGFGAGAAGYVEDDGRLMRQAEALREAHNALEAASLLRGYMGMHGDDANALVLLAKIDAEQGDRAGAEGLLVRAIAAKPDSVPAHTALGKLLLEEGREPEAMDRFEAALALDPRDKEARQGELDAVTKLAVSAREGNRPDAALAALEHAQTKLIDEPQLLFELGVQATELGDFPEAQRALGAARKLDADNPDVLYALARVEIEEQHMAEAQADLLAYLARRPGDATAHYGLGHVLAMEQRKDEARAEFERSIVLQPVQTESYYQLGEMELELQHDALARPLFQRVLARDAKHGGALTAMGILDFRARDYEAAEHFLTNATKAAPEYQPAHYYLGLVLARLGRKQESQRELALATELDRKQQGPPGVSARGSRDEPKKEAPR